MISSEDISILGEADIIILGITANRDRMERSRALSFLESHCKVIWLPACKLRWSLTAMSYPILYDEPARLRRRSWWMNALIVVGVVLFLVGGGAAAAYWYVSQDLPSLNSVTAYQPSLVSRVYSDEREVVGQFFVER